jgi:hypothetical protein
VPWLELAGVAEIFPGMTVFLLLLRNANWKTASCRIGLAVASGKSFIFFWVRNQSGTRWRNA